MVKERRLGNGSAKNRSGVCFLERFWRMNQGLTQRRIVELTFLRICMVRAGGISLVRLRQRMLGWFQELDQVGSRLGELHGFRMIGTECLLEYFDGFIACGFCLIELLLSLINGSQTV